MKNQVVCQNLLQESYPRLEVQPMENEIKTIIRTFVSFDEFIRITV